VLPEGDVTLDVEYSGVNFNDGLAVVRGGVILKSFPMVPGIDLTGTVAASDDAQFEPGAVPFPLHPGPIRCAAEGN
jgi:acrylyl-CoA reductase (NADPH)